jgi:hypothetical protein
MRSAGQVVLVHRAHQMAFTDARHTITTMAGLLELQIQSLSLRWFWHLQDSDPWQAGCWCAVARHGPNYDGRLRMPATH